MQHHFGKDVKVITNDIEQLADHLIQKRTADINPIHLNGGQFFSLLCS